MERECLNNLNQTDNGFDTEDCIIESHRNHIDVQFVISGSIMVIKNNVPHMGCVQIDEPEKVKKLDCKVEV